MIRRRALLGVLASGAAMAAVPPGGRLAFSVLRNTTPVGEHVLEFTEVADGLDIRIAVDIVVRLGPIALFRYKLRGLEQWRGGQVVAASADCDNNGREAFFRATRGPEGLRVQGSAVAPYVAPDGALPATHWNPAEFDAPMVNPQDGTLMRPAVARFANEELPLPDGRRINARRFALSGDVRMELWYDEARRWSALRAPGRDGSTIHYNLN